MLKFIEVKDHQGKNILLAVEHIRAVTRLPDEKRCYVYVGGTDESTLVIQETYEHLCTMIARAATITIL